MKNLRHRLSAKIWTITKVENDRINEVNAKVICLAEEEMGREKSRGVMGWERGHM